MASLRHTTSVQQIGFGESSTCKRDSLTLLLGLMLFCFGESLIAQTFIPGETYYDSTNYVEYRAGNLPIVISAPHGGSLEPATIPDRDCNNCVVLKDSWTKPITEGVYDAIVEQTGCYPHVIINLLHRKKFDANRDVGDAADGNLTVEKTWRGYHALIDSAKAQVAKDYGRGIFFDMHGHSHTVQRIELGYLLSGGELRLTDSVLNTSEFIEESSLKTLAGDNIQSLIHSELIRGETSFGTILTYDGFPSVPSVQDPFPMEGESYFSGGYNTQRHGSRDNSGPIDGVQIELNRDIRFNDSTRQVLIQSLATSIVEYIDQHYNSEFGEPYCGLLVNNENGNLDAPNFTVYPNPTHNQFFIESSFEEASVVLYNSLGQHVCTKAWNGQPITVEHLPKGFYLVQLRDRDKIVGVERLIVGE
ncbi:MAG: T9SS type A sorting domain-containing protein [Saprospiraceae bacterium]